MLYSVYSCCVIIINTAYLKTGGIYCIIGKGSMFSSEDGSIINLYCYTYMDSFLNRNVLLGIYSKHNLSIAKKFNLTTTKNVTDSDPFDGFQIRARLWSWSDYTVCIVYSVYILWSWKSLQYLKLWIQIFGPSLFRLANESAELVTWYYQEHSNFGNNDSKSTYFLHNKSKRS